jgi:NitT/TauT family transport system permease protein
MQLNKEERAKFRKKKVIINRILTVFAPLITFLILLAIWETIVVVRRIPAWQIVAPSAAFRAMVVNFDSFIPHLVRSYSNILIGFALAVVVGICLAALINNFELLGILLTPYITMLVTTPIMTLVPLLIVLFGFARWILVFAVLAQAFPILNMNTVTGLNNVEVMKLELMHSLRATRLQTFRYCTLPAALPNVFTGMKLSGIFATTATVGAEFTAGTVGLGAMIIAHTQFMRTAQAFASIFFVALIGLFLYISISLLEMKLVKWKI